jgi:hypothetical protein
MYRYERHLHALFGPPFQSQEAREPVTECGGKDVDVVEQPGLRREDYDGSTIERMEEVETAREAAGRLAANLPQVFFGARRV